MPTFEKFIEARRLVICDANAEPTLVGLLEEFETINAGTLKFYRRHGGPMALRLIVVDKWGFNAFAASLDDCDVIGINRGVYGILLATARGVVSQGFSTSQFAGNQSDVAGRTVSGSPKDVLRGIAALDPSPLQDDSQDLTAHRIARVAFHFMLFHELAHLVNGHCDWVGLNRAVSLICEMNDGQFEALEGLERETLEWDADSEAIREILEITLQPHIGGVGGRATWSVPERNSFGTPQDAFKFVGAAISICSAYFGAFDDNDFLSNAPRTHPHPVLRMLSFRGATVQNLAFRCGMTYDEASRFTSPFLEPMRQLNAFFTRDPSVSPPSDIIEIKNARTRQYQHHWAKLHPELDRLKRGGMLAPAQPVAHPAFPTTKVLG